MTLSIEEALARIAELNPALNAFITVADPATVAPVSDGPLRGLPISIKDLIDVAGMPTTAASRAYDAQIAERDAIVVARLRHAGAVIIGKTNLHEFALGTINDESAFGPARNPYDERRSPGGSSGGSAASVAACMSWATIGTDTGGSIRIPAAACGIVGLKPSFGEVPTTGVLPLSASLDHVGPLTRTVSDAWTIYDVIRGHAPDKQQPHGPLGVTLGRLGGYFLEKLDDDVRAQFDGAIHRLELAGARVADVTIAGAANIPGIYNSVVLPEAYAHHAARLDARRNDYMPGVAERLESGRTVPRHAYVQAQTDRTVLRDRVDAALGKCDALILPALAIPAPLIGATTVRIGSKDEPIRPMMLRLTNLFNLTGHPAMSIPCGFTTDGLPCGFQMVGRRQDTSALLALALGCEPHITVEPFSCSGRRTATAAG